MEHVEYNFVNIFSSFFVNKKELYYDITYEKNNILNKRFDKIIDEALEDSKSKGNIIFKISNKNSNMFIKRLLGIDICERGYILSKDYIRHLYKHSKEINKKQISITKKDIKKIPEILLNPDSIVNGSPTLDASRKNKISSIRYVKSYKTEKFFLIVAIPKKGNLQIKTMWKEVTKLIHSNNAFHHTSQTANSNSSTLNSEIVSK